MNIFTFDIDWAPEEVITDLLDILRKYNVSATLFATHESKVLKKVEAEGRHEIGIHPNFNFLLNGSKQGNYQAVIDNLLELYPSAIGLRSHSLAHSCPMLIYALEKKMKYDSNIYMPFYQDLKPFDYFGLLRIPYNWEDDGQWVAGRPFDNCGLNLKAPLNIFSFHPIHVYLNTHNQQMYDELKHFYQMPKELLKNRNHTIPGARDLLLALLQTCAVEKLPTCSLKEYYFSLAHGDTILK